MDKTELEITTKVENIERCFEGNPIPCAVIKILTDENNQPIDFNFLYVNDSLVEMVVRL